MKELVKEQLWSIRPLLMAGVLTAVVVLLVWRAVQLHMFPEEVSTRLPDRAKNQHIGEMRIPPRRGEIVDRNGSVLALSTPVVTVGVSPRQLLALRQRWTEERKNGDQSQRQRAEGALLLQQSRWKKLDKLLGKSSGWFRQKLEHYASRHYIPLKRQVAPHIQKQIAALEIKGVEFRRGARRYYPEGEAMASFLGFTNQKDRGQEGIELVYDQWLSGSPERVSVVRDASRNAVETLGLIERGEDGKRIQLSLDRRLQFLAYRSLNRALIKHDANSGSVVVLDSNRGEVLAMVNLPSFNPNDRTQRKGGALRNRAVTDVLEPGSTMKPFTVAAALENGVVTTATVLDTAPGRYRIGRKVITEYRNKNYGEVTMERLLQKSSNVGSAMVAMEMKPEQMWKVLDRAGVGEPTGSGFPGEVAGVLRDHARWRKVEQATISYGYGISLTALQLARAYQALAEEGVVRPISLIHQPDPSAAEETRRVFSQETARQVRLMMETVTQPGGTATRAAVEGYRVAGKTGTVNRLVGGRYLDEAGEPFGNIALFAGLAPVESPEIVIVVVVDDPKENGTTGGAVAAPVFADVMGGALRVMGVPPSPSMDQEAQHG